MNEIPITVRRTYANQSNRNQTSNIRLGGRTIIGESIANAGFIDSACTCAGILASVTTMLVAQRSQPGESFAGLGRIELRTQTEHRHALLDELLDDVDELLNLGEPPGEDHVSEPVVALGLGGVWEPNVVANAHPFDAVWGEVVSVAD